MIFDFVDWSGPGFIREQMRKKGFLAPDEYIRLMATDSGNCMNPSEMICAMDEINEHNFKRDKFALQAPPVRERSIKVELERKLSSQSVAERTEHLNVPLDEFKWREANRILPENARNLDVLDSSQQVQYATLVGEDLGYQILSNRYNGIKDWLVVKSGPFMGWLGIRSVPVYQSHFEKTARVDFTTRIGLIRPKKYVGDFKSDNLVWGWECYAVNHSLLSNYGVLPEGEFDPQKVSDLTKLTIWAHLCLVKEVITSFSNGRVEPKAEYLERLKSR